MCSYVLARNKRLCNSLDDICTFFDGSKKVFEIAKSCSIRNCEITFSKLL